MGYPSAAPRMTRCNLKDLASCFCSCRFPLEEELNTLSISTQPIRSEDRRMGFNCRGENGHEKMFKKDTGEWAQRRQHNSSLQRNIDQICRKGEARLSEEDYIVFCFKKNGEIEMISDGHPSIPHHVYDPWCTNTAAAVSPITRKLQYGESIELMWDSRRGVMVSPISDDILLNGNGVVISSINKDERKGSMNGMSTAGPPDEKQYPNLHWASKMGQPTESRGSNLSESSDSTASFTFPNLGVEWIGSPVHLPKAEECNKASSCVMGLHCCRF